jgi:hypothetical protein
MRWAPATLEDIGEIAASVFTDSKVAEAGRAAQVAMAGRFFGPGGILATVERRSPARLR